MRNANENFQENIAEILNRLTLAQKIALCSGANEWETKEIRGKNGEVLIPSVRVSDGPHGLRKTIGKGDNLGLADSYPATCFPAESLLACSFDRTLAEKMGKAIAEEAAAAGVCTVLGPGANIKRNPLCGRNFEYLSEDPFLSGRMAASYIKGCQSRGIGTSLKHFACNSQEYYRMTSDSRLDERTLREIYLSAFEYAIKKAAPATVMCAYNRVNGIACSDNEYLLDTILRREWGYDGLVISDWGALNDRIRAFRAGCDLIMPGGNSYEESDVKKAVRKGALSESLVDRSAERVIRFVMAHRAGKNVSEQQTSEQIHERSHETAREIAENSAVLLKNENQILPLHVGSENLCIIGSMAKNFRIQGSGSSKIHPVRRESFPDLLAAELESAESIRYAAGYRENGETDEELLRETLRLAETSEKVLILAGLPEQYEAEGLDRRDMRLPEGQNRLIEAVAKVNPRVIVVLICGCAVELPWESQVAGILWMGLPGQAGESALARVLTGKVNPSGRLAESWPLRYEDCASAERYLREGKDAEYREGIFVGYRHYDRARIPVRYAFGHGLGYTDFLYSDLMAEKKADHWLISVCVKNIGTREGAHSVLLFMEAPQNGICRPVRELKGFEKVHLKPQENCTVSFVTDDRTFAVWNKGWKIYRGEYHLAVGDCRIAIDLAGEEWDGTETPFPERCMGDSRDSEKYSVNSTIAEVSEDVGILRLVYHWFERKQAQTYGRGSAEYLSAMSSADECPLRGVQNLIGLPNHLAQAMADFGNGHYLAGIRHFLS